MTCPAPISRVRPNAAHRRAGYLRDHRPDCKQACIGLVVSREGYPLGYEVFAGNRTGVTTLRGIVDRMETRYGREGGIWAVDRRMISKANLNWLRERGSRHIVGTLKGEFKQFAKGLFRLFLALVG